MSGIHDTQVSKGVAVKAVLTLVLGPRPNMKSKRGKQATPQNKEDDTFVALRASHRQEEQP